MCCRQYDGSPSLIRLRQLIGLAAREQLAWKTHTPDRPAGMCGTPIAHHVCDTRRETQREPVNESRARRESARDGLRDVSTVLPIHVKQRP